MWIFIGEDGLPGIGKVHTGHTYTVSSTTDASPFNDNLLDALYVAGGHILCKVSVKKHNALSANLKEFMITNMLDASEPLDNFARLCARRVLIYWRRKVPKSVMSYIDNKDKLYKTKCEKLCFKRRDDGDAEASAYFCSARNEIMSEAVENDLKELGIRKSSPYVQRAVMSSSYAANACAVHAHKAFGSHIKTIIQNGHVPPLLDWGKIYLDTYENAKAYQNGLLTELVSEEIKNV